MAARRTFRRLRLPRRPWQVFSLLALMLALAIVRQWRPELFQPAAPPLESTACRVARVVDGDTLVLADDAAQRVRLIGADTPETVKPDWPVEPWGPEATTFTKTFLADGPIRLEFDGPRHDKYGRLLAYVWVGDRMLNEELIRAGLARAKLHFDYSAAMKARFRHAETEAKTARRGIWSEGTGTTDQHR